MRVHLFGCTDAVLQVIITGALELRDAHARNGDEWLAERWNELLIIAREVRDQRPQLRRAVDDVYFPITVTPIPDDELDDIPDDEP